MTRIIGCSFNNTTGGHLRPDLYGHIPTYIERFGVETAAELAEFEIAHVQAIKEVVEKEKIDCDFTLTRTVDVWANQDAADKAKGVYDKMVGHGLKYMNDVHFTMGKDAPGVIPPLWQHDLQKRFVLTVLDQRR